MSATQPAAPHYRLRTFGTLALLGPGDDTVLGNHGHHRRRLALLAALAAAGDQGRSRDQLLLLFWPDATQSRARHSLEQLLYALRSSIGESVFLGTNPVRLNPDVIESDVSAFNAALERGDPGAAVAGYRGPFLDGFYLNDAPEYAQWAEGERARLASRHADALERLARAGEAAHDHAAAVRWWRKLAEVDPVSSKYATGLIRAFKNAGDHPAALQYAERYEAVVAQELGTSAGPAIAALVAEVRAETRAEPVASGKPAPLSPQPKPAAPPATPDATPGATPGTTPVMVDQPRPEPGQRRRPMRYLIGALAAATIVVATAAWLRAARGDDATVSPTPAARSSIAVLAFTNVSRNPQDATIVDGLAEELMAALYQIPNLRVVARNSAFAFRNSDLDVRRIGDSLRVSNLLEGSVQRNGSRLRVRVRLVDVHDGSTRWSDTYEKELDDIFEVQSDIASAVARELKLQLGAGAARKLRAGPTQNIAAFELYKLGRDPVHMRSPADSGPMLGLAQLRQAVALDPDFAAAYAQMAYMYFGLSSRAPTLDSARVLKRLAEDAARKAISLDPNLPEAYAGLAVAHAIGLSDLRASEAALRRAIALGGAPRVREHLSRVMMWTGRYEEALAEALRAEEEDPLSASAIADVGQALCMNGRYQEGLAQLRRVAALRPPLQRVTGYTALCHALEGKWTEAIAAFGPSPGRVDPWAPLLGYAVARSGDVAEARRMQADATARWRQTGRGAYSVAVIAAGLGDYDQAFEWLDRTGDDLLATTSIISPLFEEMHADPRFERHRQRLGLQKR